MTKSIEATYPGRTNLRCEDSVRWRRAARVGAGVLVATLLLVRGPLPPAWAGAIWLYEMATPDQGTAAAGRAALALDASTVWLNPAGMTRLDRSQLLLGAGAVVIQSTFDVDPGTTTSGGGASITTALPVGSGFYVQNLTQDFKLGVSLTTLPGLAADYGDTWAGRYHLEKVALLGVALSATAAYRVLPWLSIGAGPSLGHSHLGQDTAINNALDGLPDGTFKVRGNAWAPGGVVGIMLEPTATTRVGVQYTTPMTFQYNDIIDEVQGAGPSLQFLRLLVGARVNVPVGSQVDLKLTMPQQIMASAYHAFNDKLALMLNFGWQNWSAFGRPSVVISGNPNQRLSLDLNYNDTFHTAIGAHYQLTPDWLLKAGFAYDTSAVSDANRTLSFPVDRQFRYALGAQYALTKNITLGADLTIIDAGSAPVNQVGGPLQGTVVGSYSPNLLYAVGLNLIWRF
jgi:long-chain fatty acid transport protein